MSRLDGHVAAVRRKLTLGLFIQWLAATGFVVAVLALVGVLIQRCTQLAAPQYTLSIGMGLAVAAALVVSIMQRPSPLAAAVAIDEKLALKEKFSTALHARQLNDPFAQAAVRDAEVTAEKVRLSGQFPLAFPRTGYATVLATALALLALLLPQGDLLGREQKDLAKREEERKLAETHEVVRKAIAKIEALPPAMRESEDIRIAQRNLEDLMKHPPVEPDKAARRAVEQLAKAEDAMKKQATENKNFGQAQKAMSMFKSMDQPVDAEGPVAEAHRAIVKGDFAQAMKELQKAAEKLKDMTPEQKQQAAKQMAQLAQQLNQQAQNKQAQQKLAQQMQQAGANQQQIQQAQQLMQQAAQGDKQAQQQLQQMAQQMQQQGANQQQMQQMMQNMQQAQQAANAQQQAQAMAQAAQAMAQAMQQMQAGAQAGGQAGNQQMADAQQQMQDLLQQMAAMQQDAQAVQAAQQAMQDALAQAGGQLDTKDVKPGQNQGQWKAGDPNKKGQGQGGPGIGAGGGLGKDQAPFGSKQEISKTPYNEKGQHLASIYVKDRSIRGDAKLQLGDIAQAAAADEGDDVDNTQIDRRQQKVMQEYFRVMAEEAKKQ
jgi:hypothetical protein